MGRNPSGAVQVIFQGAVLCRAMASLASKEQAQARAEIAQDGETDGIAVALGRKLRTASGITQIAEFVQFVRGRVSAFVSGSGAVSVPSPTKGQARRMEPGTIQFLHRHEKGTRHDREECCARNIVRGNASST
jgi:hypothetical protein